MKPRKSVKKSLSDDEEVTAFESEPLPKRSMNQLSVQRLKFICAICKKNFSDKNCLKKHIKKIHNVEPEPLLKNETPDIRVAPFKCRVCETEFAYKRNLKRHLIKYHSQGLEDEEGGNCFCYVEGCKFRSFFINALRTHLTEEHQVQIEVENKTFSSKAEFDRWKEEEEKTNVCLFIKEAGKHTLINGDQRLIFQCHRSGHYSGHGFGKRSFRVKGTCKLGKRCTAGIELTVKDRLDTYEVVYYKTHIWHTADVVHVNLSASERTYLANKLKEGTSISSILESVKADQSDEGINLGKRIHLLKRKDLVNIENTFRLNNTERHLRKQHKKGQKIDSEKIKKNIDGHGDVVSWVVESSCNASEYFTVKQLQSEKCVESCGVFCVPCNACLHMFSCTCHDYLLFGTMCMHVHSVSLSLNPVHKSKRKLPKPSQNDTPKRKKKEKLETQIEVVEVTDHKDDILNFLAKNLELEQEEELQQERRKLRDKLEYFNSLLTSRIDQLDESSVQMFLKMIDSAIGSLSGSPQSCEVEMLDDAHSISNSVVPTNNETNHLLSVSVHQVTVEPDNDEECDTQLQKHIASMTTVPVESVDKKYEVPLHFSPPQKKKRRLEEPVFYRPSVLEKKPIYDTVISDHALVNDNFVSFDCNLQSWPAATMSGNATVAKWWT